jgi:hypothetical protein
MMSMDAASQQLIMEAIQEVLDLPVTLKPLRTFLKKDVS